MTTESTQKLLKDFCSSSNNCIDLYGIRKLSNQQKDILISMIGIEDYHDDDELIKCISRKALSSHDDKFIISAIDKVKTLTSMVDEYIMNDRPMPFHVNEDMINEDMINIKKELFIIDNKMTDIKIKILKEDIIAKEMKINEEKLVVYITKESIPINQLKWVIYKMYILSKVVGVDASSILFQFFDDITNIKSSTMTKVYKCYFNIIVYIYEELMKDEEKELKSYAGKLINTWIMMK